MTVEHLHIITMNTDDMVRKSALGFLYKYMMRADVKSITLVHLEGATGEHTFLNRFKRHQDGIHWVDQPTGKWLETEKEFDASVHPEHAAELEKLIAQRVQTEKRLWKSRSRPIRGTIRMEPSSWFMTRPPTSTGFSLSCSPRSCEPMGGKRQRRL